jgi:hypothetical protein
MVNINLSFISVTTVCGIKTALLSDHESDGSTVSELFYEYLILTCNLKGIIIRASHAHHACDYFRGEGGGGKPPPMQTMEAIVTEAH